MLQIRGLVHVYPNGVRALDGIDLDAPAGVLGLLGPNGAGKSTLMRCLATLQPPTAGSVRLDGFDALAEPGRLRRALGYLPQDFGVYPRVSALALLDHLAVLKGLAARGERRDAVEALLRRVNLWDARHRPLASLSGGMRQRFGVAQALIGAPRVVIVDEPAAGLDPHERNALLELLAELGETTVVILSTHIVEDAADLCGHIAVLAGGRLRAQGVPATLVAALEGRVWTRPVDHAALDGLAARHRLLAARRSAGRLVARVLAETRPDGFEPAPATLEDAYFAALAEAREAPGARASDRAGEPGGACVPDPVRAPR